jgi:PAS domain S-box-containing protein
VHQSTEAEPGRGRRRIVPTGIERKLGAQDIIVSKPDTKGRITYANRVFLEIADYRESEVLGRPHNLIRHPDMPRAVFALLWERMQQKRELFAYVVNLCKGGDHYWVLAHVTPSCDTAGAVVGYHSNRRRPSERALEVIRPLYAELRTMESADTNRKRGLERATARLHGWAEQQGKSYDALMFAL